MESLVEIEAAIARLPEASRRQLVRDLPALCPDLFPADGWEAILADASPRPAFSADLDALDAAYAVDPHQFKQLTEKSLRSEA